MKKVAMIATALLVAACAETTTTTSATAVDQFIGKSLVGPNATFEYSADGTVGGNFRGDAVEGTYTSSATEICTTFSAPETLAAAGDKFCSTPAVDGNTVIFNRRDGSQSAQYTIEG